MSQGTGGGAQSPLLCYFPRPLAPRSSSLFRGRDQLVSTWYHWGLNDIFFYRRQSVMVQVNDIICAGGQDNKSRGVSLARCVEFQV